jgi:hypothetical protein
MEVCHRNGLPVARANVPVLGGRRLLFSNYVVEYDAAIGADLLDRMKAWHDRLAPTCRRRSTTPSRRTTRSARSTRTSTPASRSSSTSMRPSRSSTRSHAEKATKDAARLMRSTVLDRMGRAQYAVCNGARIARRQPDGPDRTKFVPVAKNTDFALVEASA